MVAVCTVCNKYGIYVEVIVMLARFVPVFFSVQKNYNHVFRISNMCKIFTAKNLI